MRQATEQTARLNQRRLNAFRAMNGRTGKQRPLSARSARSTRSTRSSRSRRSGGSDAGNGSGASGSASGGGPSTEKGVPRAYIAREVVAAMTTQPTDRRAVYLVNQDPSMPLIQQLQPGTGGYSPRLLDARVSQRDLDEALARPPTPPVDKQPMRGAVLRLSRKLGLLVNHSSSGGVRSRPAPPHARSRRLSMPAPRRRLSVASAARRLRQAVSPRRPTTRGSSAGGDAVPPAPARSAATSCPAQPVQVYDASWAQALLAPPPPPPPPVDTPPHCKPPAQPAGASVAATAAPHAPASTGAPARTAAITLQPPPSPVSRQAALLAGLVLPETDEEVHAVLDAASPVAESCTRRVGRGHAPFASGCHDPSPGTWLLDPANSPFPAPGEHTACLSPAAGDDGVDTPDSTAGAAAAEDGEAAAGLVTGPSAPAGPPRLPPRPGCRPQSSSSRRNAGRAGGSRRRPTTRPSSARPDTARSRDPLTPSRPRTASPRPGRRGGAAAVVPTAVSKPEVVDGVGVFRSRLVLPTGTRLEGADAEALRRSAWDENADVGVVVLGRPTVPTPMDHAAADVRDTAARDILRLVDHNRRMRHQSTVERKLGMYMRRNKMYSPTRQPTTPVRHEVAKSVRTARTVRTGRRPPAAASQCSNTPVVVGTSFAYIAPTAPKPAPPAEPPRPKLKPGQSRGWRSLRKMLSPGSRVSMEDLELQERGYKAKLTDQQFLQTKAAVDDCLASIQQAHRRKSRVWTLLDGVGDA